MNIRLHFTKWLTTMEWQTKIQSYFQKLRKLLGQCDLCGNNTHRRQLICDACFQDLPLFNQDIIQGDLLNWPAVNRALPNIAFDQLFCLSPYLPPFSHWLIAFKYKQRFELADMFSTLLSERWQATSFSPQRCHIDLVLSVPLHITKWQIRGYNQAHLIAKPFAKMLNLPYQALALKRIKENTSQVGKTGKQRRQNLANNFELTQKLDKEVKHVILIDDVVTTGSTASEISKLLKKSGVKTVTLVTVCLTLPRGC